MKVVDNSSPNFFNKRWVVTQTHRSIYNTRAYIKRLASDNMRITKRNKQVENKSKYVCTIIVDPYDNPADVPNLL